LGSNPNVATFSLIFFSGLGHKEGCDRSETE
jgi:hypothetical protein